MVVLVIQFLGSSGKTLAESSSVSPMSQGILTTPDYSGLIYDFDGHIMSLQVAPKPTTSNATSITAPTPSSASTGRDSLTRWLASLFDSSESYKPYFFELLKRSLFTSTKCDYSARNIGIM
jgi:hypothetical protein